VFSFWKKNPDELLREKGWTVSVDDKCLCIEGQPAVPISKIEKVKWRRRPKSGSLFDQHERASVMVDYENDENRAPTALFSGKDAERKAKGFAEALESLLRKADPAATFRGPSGSDASG
jgi:hypothetical protein